MKQTALAFDQLVNTLAYIKGDGFGMADESLSARLFRCHINGLISARAYRSVDALFFWQDQHCYQSWISEFTRSQLPKEYR